MDHYTLVEIFLLINFQVPAVICFAQLDSDQGREPQCRSQFDYEYKVVQKIVALENLCEGLKNTKDRLQAEIQTTNDELRSEIQTAHDMQAEMERTINGLRAEIQTTTNEIQDLKSKTAGQKLAFLATMEISISVSAQSTVKFDTVVTNIGSGYNVTDGMFTAQYDGIYQFSASMMTNPDGEIWSYFSLNGEKVAMIYAHASERRHDQGANTVILQLQKGDRVCVVSQNTSTIYGGRYSSFSGTLL